MRMELNYFLDSSNYKKITITGNHYGDNYPNPYKSLITVTREYFSFSVTEGKGSDLPRSFTIDGSDYNKNYVAKFLILCNALKHTIIDYNDQYESSDFNEGEFVIHITFENGEELNYKFKAVLNDVADDLAAALRYFAPDNELPYGYKMDDYYDDLDEE